jgi:hypothetical protein
MSVDCRRGMKASRVEREEMGREEKCGTGGRRERRGWVKKNLDGWEKREKRMGREEFGRVDRETFAGKCCVNCQVIGSNMWPCG